MRLGVLHGTVRPGGVCVSRVSLGAVRLMQTDIYIGTTLVLLVRSVGRGPVRGSVVIGVSGLDQVNLGLLGARHVEIVLENRILAPLISSKM